VAAGQYIVQIELCQACTVTVMDRDAKPQFGLPVE
jgi:hypothetical protein